jgi:5-methylcytosine-specific restriction endonuclease McrA
MADVLVLNADGLPVSYLPLSTIQWKEAVTYLWLDKVTVLDWYDDWIVRSSSWETRVPAVIMLKDMMKRKKTPRFSKTNVFLRDLHHCQYCNTLFPKSVLTMDHVLPISHGGKTSWENIVTACSPCNAKKGNDKRIKPKITPYQPDYYELVNKRKQLEFDIRHPSWEMWLK